jgi:hypothetical protein
MSLKRIVLLSAATMVLLAPGAALASHGKAGLWSSTTTMTMNGMPPQTHAATFCMTAAQVNADRPVSENPDCTYSNVQVSGHTMSADMVCKGKFNATGHFASTYDSDTHYTAQMSMQMQGITMNNTIEGRWVKADCAGADH